MAESIKFNDDKYVDASGIYDSTLGITQEELNSEGWIDITSGCTFTNKFSRKPLVVINRKSKLLKLLNYATVTASTTGTLITLPSGILFREYSYLIGFNADNVTSYGILASHNTIKLDSNTAIPTMNYLCFCGTAIISIT